MGLRDLTRRDLKFIKVLLKVLEYYGISEEDLKKLPKIIKNLENNEKEINNDNIPAKTQKDKQVEPFTPEEFVKMFAGDAPTLNLDVKGSRNGEK